MVQWLRCCASTAGVESSVPGWGSYCMPCDAAKKKKKKIIVIEVTLEKNWCKTRLKLDKSLNCIYFKSF